MQVRAPIPLSYFFRDVLIFISFFIDAFDEDIRITKSNG